MFSILFRRLQKFLRPLKFLVLVGSLAGIVYMILNVSPTVVTILGVTLLIFVFLMTFFSVFSKTKTAFLVALLASFLLFLKAVDLLTPLNLGLFALFVVFLAFYLYKQAPK
jgi:hypothetical protein